MVRIVTALFSVLVALIALALPKRVLSDFIAGFEAAQRLPIGEATDLDIEVIVL